MTQRSSLVPPWYLLQAIVPGAVLWRFHGLGGVPLLSGGKTRRAIALPRCRRARTRRAGRSSGPALWLRLAFGSGFFCPRTRRGLLLRRSRHRSQPADRDDLHAARQATRPHSRGKREALHRRCAKRSDRQVPQRGEGAEELGLLHRSRPGALPVLGQPPGCLPTSPSVCASTAGYGSAGRALKAIVTEGESADFVAELRRALA